MSIPYTEKINERLIPASIIAENHTIGIVGVATYLPGLIRLVEVPQGPYPSVTIVGLIPAVSYTEIPGGLPAPGQFLVDYTNGVISFNTSQDGNTVSVSYTGLGSEIAAEDINELQEPLNTIAQLTTIYNWPSAPTEVWSIASTAAVLSLQSDNNLPLLTGAVKLVSGSNINLAQVGQAITINAAESSGGITALTGDVTTSSSNPTLLTAATYATLGATTVTNTGDSVLIGNLGLNPGTSVTGFPPGTFSGVENIANAAASQAQTDASSAYTTLNALPFTTDLSGMVLGTGGVISTLAPGVYKFISTAQLTGTLTLDAGGNPGAEWVFQIGSALTTSSGSSIVIINSGSPNNVYWLMGSSATLGTGTSFQGTLIATASITINTGASLTGRAIALTGAVTLDDNTITVPPSAGGIEVATISNGVITPSMITTSISANFDFPNNVYVAGSLGVGTLTTVASALLELDSTTQGFLPPRMTTIQMNAISSPAEGLMIYATDIHQWCGWDGSVWVILG